MDDLQALVNGIHQEIAAQTERGKVADYIPELAAVDPAAVRHRPRTGGRAGGRGRRGRHRLLHPERVQVFTLTLALGRVGDRLWNRVGREPSGTPFNSMVQLEREQGKPRNPFINAGAIAVADVLLSRAPAEGDRSARSCSSSASWRATIDRRRRARRPLGGRNRLPQRRACPLHAFLRQARPSRPSMCSASISTTARSP